MASGFGLRTCGIGGLRGSGLMSKFVGLGGLGFGLQREGSRISSGLM